MLESLQKGLETHFEKLATERDTSAHPIFALEHGLSEDEICRISTFLQEPLRSNISWVSEDYWLLWVIHATEVGYHYDGHEYWQSFEEKTKNWNPKNRWKIARWCKKFAEEYNGVIPKGYWAEHFRYISWPITHAILPKYSQRQFAYTLYKASLSIASRNPIEIGQLLIANSYGTSSRFQEFLQQKELAGRITLALLFEDGKEQEEIIYKPTLERLVRGLEETRASKDFLNRARIIARDRFKGIANGTITQRGHSPVEEKIRTNDDSCEHNTKISIMPDISLQCTDADTWLIYLDIPSFQELAILDETIGNFISNNRCIINGIEDSRKAAGWLLDGPNKVVIKTWFNVDKPLIQFEKDDSIIQNILMMGCTLSPNKTWLFKISEGGTAREISSKIVRSAQHYILLLSEEAFNDKKSNYPEWVDACEIDCENIFGLILCIPDIISDKDSQWLNSFGLQQEGIVEVWPAGLCARGWDGEGNSEWLTSESPCFGIFHDFPVKEYLLTINNNEQKTIEVREKGKPIFIELGKLLPGQHILSVKAIREENGDESLQKVNAEGYATLRVRDPRPWEPGIISHSGLLVRNDPLQPKFSDFWKNEIEILVYGPANHSIKISLEAKDKQDNIICNYICDNMPLPINLRQWEEILEKFHLSLLETDKMRKYHFASDISLVFDGGELGKHTINLDRSTSALRWFIAFLEDEKREVMLLDDTGLEEEVKATEFSMKLPLEKKELSTENISKGYIVSEAGGSLFQAHKDKHKDIIIVSNNDSRYLGIVPECKKNFTQDIFKMLNIWSNARILDLSSSIKQKQMIECLIGEIYRYLCYDEWMKLEKECNSNSMESLQNLKNNVSHNSGFNATLEKHGIKIAKHSFSELTSWYAGAVGRYLKHDDPLKICLKMLTIASQPHKMEILRAKEMKGLRKTPEIMRGARFLAIASAVNGNFIKYGNILLPRWEC